jgi:hypothetical protein
MATIPTKETSSPSSRNEYRLLLSEVSCNASYVRSGVIVHKDSPVSQWMIIKIGYNVYVKHVVVV